MKKRLKQWNSASKIASQYIKVVNSGLIKDKLERKQYKPQVLKISETKLSLYNSYYQIVTQLKKRITKEIAEYSKPSSSFALENINPIIFNDRFLLLNFDIELKIDDSIIIKVKDKDQSPLLSLLEAGSPINNINRVTFKREILMIIYHLRSLKLRFVLNSQTKPPKKY